MRVSPYILTNILLMKFYLFYRCYSFPFETSGVYNCLCFNENVLDFTQYFIHKFSENIRRKEKRINSKKILYEI